MSGMTKTEREVVTAAIENLEKAETELRLHVTAIIRALGSRGMGSELLNAVKAERKEFARLKNIGGE